MAAFAFGVAAVGRLAVCLVQARVTLAAGFDSQAQQIDMRHLQLLALPGFQGAALQGWRVDAGRRRKHHLLAVAQVGAQLIVEESTAAYVALQSKALRFVSIDL